MFAVIESQEARPFRTPRTSVLGVGLALCLLVFAFTRWVLWPVVISGDSMSPSYHDGQPNYINKLAYWSHSPQRGDVVGVRVRAGDYSIKRIVGCPGDRIEFRRGTVVVNGQPLVEPYVQHPLLWLVRPVQLGPDEYFVMGDNRTYSTLGEVRRDAIVGKAVF